MVMPLQTKRTNAPKRSAIIAGLLALSSWFALLPALAPQHLRAQQTPAAETQATPQRKTSTPYTGDLSRFEYADRDKKLQVERVMDLLGIAPGKSVADIGAGSGWFSVRAARRVKSNGLVYAVDINPEAVTYIEQRAKRESIGNIKVITGKPDDPMLPSHSVDAVLLLKTYHEVAQPVALMKRLRESLRPGARVGIIDRNGTPEDHGVNRDIVLREMGEAGFASIGKYEFVKGDNEDYFLVFEAK
jgi:cyclopropane fatty-acyl-phospholipid synthase-like methyltransferase